MSAGTPICPTNEKRAEYHLTRTVKIKSPAQDVAFWAADGGSAHAGEFWAFAPMGLWLTCGGVFVHVRKATKHDAYAFGPEAQWIEVRA